MERLNNIHLQSTPIFIFSVRGRRLLRRDKQEDFSIWAGDSEGVSYPAKA